MKHWRLLATLLMLALGSGIVACTLPVLGRIGSLDEDTLNRLRLSMDQTIQMQPGETHAFSLGVVECCYVFVPVEASATWSAEPMEGASIDPRTGVLTVEPTAPSGSMFTVSANVEDGRRIVSIEVHVFTPEQNPFVGNWREEVEFACHTGEEVIPQEPIGELAFRADGTFSVTWLPFEIYRDYAGRYEYDLQQGRLHLVVAGGNYVPDDIDGSGSFSFDDQGRLILSDMWLGSPHDVTGPANCGHRFIG